MGLADALRLAPPRTSRFARMNSWLAATRPVAKVFSVVMPPLDALAQRVSGGRTTVTELAAGLPTIYLTTRGARSGLERTVPLLAVVVAGSGDGLVGADAGGAADGGADVAVIGSNWGGARHPGWVHNLAAHPEAAVTHRGRIVDVRARELAGDEAERVWALARTVYRGYRTYPERTGGRVIRVFLLSPR
jgi:deazaflavin-dependent oxidoreductase (nitroreductase family)